MPRPLTLSTWLRRPFALLLSFFILVSYFLFPRFVLAEEAEATEDLTGLSLEELMSVEVYSAAKKPEPLFNVADAVYIITPEDIRRSGATSIPELLRMVPGVVVQKIDSNTWDISIRGFNGSIFANKLLVLIDGRSVYTPLFGGVFWDVQDVVLEDIERIEVIRGSGGTTWGENAVNGVINIITKRAQATQGTLVSAGAGSEELGFGTVRHGTKSGDWYWRTFGKYFRRDEGFRPDGTNSDDWDMARTGFRADKDQWSVQGDFYDGNIGQRTTVTNLDHPLSQAVYETADVQGWHLLSKYQEKDWHFQMYWDATYRRSLIFTERRDKIDLEYLRRTLLTEHQELSYGLEYRLNMEEIKDTVNVSVAKPPETDQLIRLFVQDEIRSLDDRFKFTVGSKFGYNIYTDFEFQPTAKAIYRLTEKSSVWTSVGRAVRIPSRIETSGQLTSHSSTLGLIRTVPDEDIEAEKVTSFEAGYRNQVSANAFFDLAAFSKHYDDLITFDLGNSVTENGFSILQLPTVNGMDGDVHGAELSGEVRINPWWKIKGYYAFLKMTLQTDSEVTDFGLEEGLENAIPRHTAYVRSSFDLPRGCALDLTVRYMDANRNVPSVIEADINLTKTINDWRISLVGQNLIEDSHPEATGSTVTEVERGGYIKVTREF